MPTMTTNTDRIEKQILLRAPRARVWRALTDADEFGSWFGVKLDGPFIAGAIRRGVIVGTTADADVAKLQREHKDVPLGQNAGWTYTLCGLKAYVQFGINLRTGLNKKLTDVGNEGGGV